MFNPKIPVQLNPGTFQSDMVPLDLGTVQFDLVQFNSRMVKLDWVVFLTNCGLVRHSLVGFWLGSV